MKTTLLLLSMCNLLGLCLGCLCAQHKAVEPQVAPYTYTTHTTTYATPTPTTVDIETLLPDWKLNRTPE